MHSVFKPICLDTHAHVPVSLGSRVSPAPFCSDPAREATQQRLDMKNPIGQYWRTRDQMVEHPMHQQGSVAGRRGGDEGWRDWGGVGMADQGGAILIVLPVVPVFHHMHT